MTCAELVAYLSAYLDRELDGDLVADADAHLATCRNCQVVLDTTRRTIRLLYEDGRQQTIPAARRAALFARLQAALWAPRQGE